MCNIIEYSYLSRSSKCFVFRLRSNLMQLLLYQKKQSSWNFLIGACSANDFFSPTLDMIFGILWVFSMEGDRSLSAN